MPGQGKVLSPADRLRAELAALTSALAGVGDRIPPFDPSQVNAPSTPTLNPFAGGVGRVGDLAKAAASGAVAEPALFAAQGAASAADTLEHTSTDASGGIFGRALRAGSDFALPPLSAFVEEQREAAGEDAGIGDALKLGTLLGFGKPERLTMNGFRVSFIPIRATNKAGKVLETSLELSHIPGQKIAYIESMGDVANLSGNAGARRRLSPTSNTLDREGLAQVFTRVEMELPSDVEWVSFERIGGGASRSGADSLSLINLKEFRAGKPLSKVLIRESRLSDHPSYVAAVRANRAAVERLGQRPENQ